MSIQLFQAPCKGYPGVTISIETLDDEQTVVSNFYNGKPGRWRVLLWDKDSSTFDYPDDFETIEQARTYCEREFNLVPADWMACEQCGSPLAFVDVIRHLYRRRLTCREALAAAYIAYHYNCIDDRGLFIFPGRGRYVTSMRVVAGDVLDVLDWDRDGCDQSLSSYDSYLFLMDALAVAEGSEEFQEMWAAFSEAARVASWEVEGARTLLPPVTPGSGPLSALARTVADGAKWRNWLSGYLVRMLGVVDDAHVVAVRRAATEERAIEIADLDGVIHLILSADTPEGGATFYLTSVDGVLREAVHRSSAKEAIEKIPLDDARVSFDREVAYWLEHAANQEPGTRN